MAYKRLDARDRGDCNRLGLYIDWHCCQIECNQLGLCINEYIVELIAISLDCVSMDVDGGFNGGFDSRFHLAVLGYQPQQSIQQLRQEAFMAISREGLKGLLLNKLVVLQTHSTGFVIQACHFTGSLMTIIIVM
jgi:hypothetical protein